MFEADWFSSVSGAVEAALTSEEGNADSSGMNVMGTGETVQWRMLARREPRRVRG